MKKNYKNIFVWTHHDLDGCVSWMLTRWAFPNANVDYRTSQPGGGFKQDFTAWSKKVDLDSYDKIFILDMDVSDSYDLIDRKNVFIIDHHKTHVENMPEVKNATTVVKEYTSAAKLVYKVYSKLYKIDISDDRKKLVLLTDDYDSYTLKLKESLNLNTIFWNTNKRFDNFGKQFDNGFVGWNEQQQNIIRLQNAKIEKLKNNLQIYSGTVKIQGKERNIYSTFANDCINDIAHFLLDTYNTDIVIVVNTKHRHVSFRRAKEIEDNLDVSELAEKLCEGGGHEYAAGGKMTEKFQTFTKVLNKID